MGETTTSMGACGCAESDGQSPPSGQQTHMQAFQDKMKEEGLNQSAIKAFEANYSKLIAGVATTMPESSIKPAEGVLNYDDLQVAADPKLLSKAVAVKLNGGLGTG